MAEWDCVFGEVGWRVGVVGWLETDGKMLIIVEIMGGSLYWEIFVWVWNFCMSLEFLYFCMSLEFSKIKRVLFSFFCFWNAEVCSRRLTSHSLRNTRPTRLSLLELNLMAQTSSDALSCGFLWSFWPLTFGSSQFWFCCLFHSPSDLLHAETGSLIQLYLLAGCSILDVLTVEYKMSPGMSPRSPGWGTWKSEICSEERQ